MNSMLLRNRDSHCALRRAGLVRGLAHTRTFAACLAALAIGACGGDGGPTPSATSAPATTAAVGAGGVSGQTPIVARPTPGPCAATGTDAIPSPLLNSQLDCAP